MMNQSLSLISPSRNNLKYLKWSYASVRKNAGPQVEYCVADDASNDGTWEWCVEMMLQDHNFKAIRNEGPIRLGHTILYDKLINEVATNRIIGIWHADMYMTPTTVEKILYTIKPGLVVSLTRVEPPLHPPGPEKVVHDFGSEPEDFDETGFLEFCKDTKLFNKSKDSNGVFAPWFIYKSDFQKIGGHDPLFAPQSKEDSDIFNRFLLKGYKFIQLWDAPIYHMTCRGSRFNPNLTIPGKNSEEWEKQNIKSTYNFIRKWGGFIKHDQNLKPQVISKYDIGLYIKNVYPSILFHLEPWFSNIYLALDNKQIVDDFIKDNQASTKFDLSQRVKIINDKSNNDISIEVDAASFTQQNYNYKMNLIQNLPQIIQESGEIGEFELDDLKIRIHSLTTYEEKLINLNSSYYTKQLLL
jgi:glycosyltransferase involved in cell wall biosynthesis